MLTATTYQKLRHGSPNRHGASSVSCNGDSALFKDGNIVIANSAMVALAQVQEEFTGEAERLGLTNEQDVVDLVKEVRREIREEQNR